MERTETWPPVGDIAGLCLPSFMEATPCLPAPALGGQDRHCHCSMPALLGCCIHVLLAFSLLLCLPRTKLPAYN